MPGDKPRSGDKPAHKDEGDDTHKKASWSPQKVSPQGGGTGNYLGGATPARHEPGYADDRAPAGGADKAQHPSTHQEGRPSLPDKATSGGATSGGADRLERGTSLADKSKA